MAFITYSGDVPISPNTMPTATNIPASDMRFSADPSYFLSAFTSLTTPVRSIMFVAGRHDCHPVIATSADVS